MTNSHVRVSLTYDNAAGAPDQVFVKLPPIDPRRRHLLGTSGMGHREARFYQHLAPLLDLGVPTPHAVSIEDDGGFAMVLEDLTASGCEPYDGIVGVTADAAAVALEARVIEYGLMLTERAPLAVRQTKRLLVRLEQPTDLTAHLDEEIALALRALSSRDGAEAIRAMLSRETPTFTGD